jgi:hypothetical protein
VRLNIGNDTATFDETVVRFDELAKSYLDNDFDAVKMFLSSTKTSIHTSYGGTDYAINGLPFPEADTYTDIPVVVNVITTGSHKISASQLQGLDNYNVTLIDNVTSFTANLKTTPDVLFTAPAGTITGRFILRVGDIATGVENPAYKPGTFNIYHAYGALNIETLADEWDGQSGSVRVLDLAGRTLSVNSNIEFSRNSVSQLNAPAVKGLYVVEIRSGAKRFVGKVVIR